MFASFFPKPRLFLLTFACWALLCVIGWYIVVSELGPQLSLAGWVGIHFADQSKALDAWLYQYMLLCYGLFVLLWMRFGGQKWARWSVLGSALIMFVTWFQVQVSVKLNEWYGTFYDLIQKALSEPNTVELTYFYAKLIGVGVIIMVAVMVSVLSAFLISHFVFRWRTAMTEYYSAKWHRVRHIEGASQRIQEDTMRFASIMEGLGVGFFRSLMTLIAFLPILWELSGYVKTLPLVGPVPQPLVFVAFVWSIFGTGLLALVGLKLPGLEFKNQRVEAAYRKELVYGEDDKTRAHPVTLTELFGHVRKNYFRLYFHYLYFNVVRFSYINIGQFIPIVALAPSIVAGVFTLGVMQRILNAFNMVENSFQYLINSWTTIVELLSIYKRLKAFEAVLDHQPLADEELRYLKQAQED